VFKRQTLTFHFQRIVQIENSFKHFTFTNHTPV